MSLIDPTDRVIGRANDSIKKDELGSIDLGIGHQEDFDVLTKLLHSLPSEIVGQKPTFKGDSVSEVDYREQTGYNFGHADGFNSAIRRFKELINEQRRATE